MTRARGEREVNRDLKGFALGTRRPVVVSAVVAVLVLSVFAFGFAGRAAAKQGEFRRSLEQVGVFANEFSFEVQLDEGRDLAFVATNGITIIDYADPANPMEVSNTPFPGTVSFDVKLTTLEIGGSIRNIAVLSHEAGARGFPGGPEGFTLYDVTNPAAPALIGQYLGPPVEEGIHNQFPFKGFLYATRERPFDDSFLVIFDIRNPSAITVAATWNLLPDHSEYAIDPSNPVLLSPENFLHDVWVVSDWRCDRDLAYLAHWDAGLRILDVTDPGSPFEVAFADYSPPEPDREIIDRIFTSPGNAHVARPSPSLDLTLVGDETFGGKPYGAVHIFETGTDVIPCDLSADDSPVELTEVGTYQVPQGKGKDPKGSAKFTPHNFDFISDEMFVLAAYKAGVRVVDISDPADPTDVAFAHTGQRFFWAAEYDGPVDGSGIIVASNDLGGVFFYRLVTRPGGET